MLSFNEGSRLVCFHTPGDRLSLDRAERSGRKKLWLLSVLLGESRHFAHLRDDFGKRQSARLFGCDSRLYGESESIYECEQSFVVPRDEIAGSAGNRPGGIFQIVRLGEEKGVASSAGILPRDRDRSEVRAGRERPANDQLLNL